MSLSPDAIAWFGARRGITEKTLAAFGVESDGARTVAFKYGEARKFRKGFEKDEEGGRRFWWDPPTSAGQVPFLPPDFSKARERMILVEGETDTMATWQALPAELRDKVGVVGLSGLNAWKEHYAEELFGEAKRVFVVIDNDDPYTSPEAASAGDKAWQQIRGDLGRKARRVRLPHGTKDLAEFFQSYDWAAFQVLLQRAAEPKRNYPRLDLTQPPPPVDWLVEDLLVRGEVTVAAGDSGIGKSFITQALGLAIAGGDEKFLGLPVHRHGRVLVVDEENTADIILQRLNALGLDPAKHLPNLEYLVYAGVDLANEPERLIEDALDLEPELIVLESLSRVLLGVEENSNTEMSQHFRRALVPLARETGAAVVAVHHTTHDSKGRPRGATSIKAAADQVLAFVAAESQGSLTGRVNIFPSKPRRQGAHVTVEIEGSMKDDGYVRVKSVEEDIPY